MLVQLPLGWVGGGGLVAGAIAGADTLLGLVVVVRGAVIKVEGDALLGWEGDHLQEALKGPKLAWRFGGLVCVLVTGGTVRFRSRAVEGSGS